MESPPIGASPHATSRGFAKSLTPLPRCSRTRRQDRIGARVDADVRAVAERSGVPLLDAASVLGRDLALRGASRYQLNGRGCEALGDALAREVLERAAEPVAHSLH